MFFISSIFLIILISSIQSLQATLKLTFIPDENYYSRGEAVEIICELLHPDDITDLPELYYVNLKTDKHTSITRSLIKSPPADAPDIFESAKKERRIQYMKRNHIRIGRLQLEDSAKYECSCPDCAEPVNKQTKDLQVMKLSDPRWYIESDWPLVEHVEAKIRCGVDEFYPYVSHKILRHHHDITNVGQAIIPERNVYPQKFSWELTVTPTADWHNTTLECEVVQGDERRYGQKTLDVLFTPRLLECHDKQHVNISEEKATIECHYAGNPEPKLTWLRQTDQKPITSDDGISIKTKHNHHGRYISILTFDRNELVSIPLTTTESLNIQADNYYQQLLNDGFIVKLTLFGQEKAVRKINIVVDGNQEPLVILNNSSRKMIQVFSVSIILFVMFLFYLI